MSVATGDVGGGRGMVVMSSRIDLRAVGVFAGVKAGGTVDCGGRGIQIRLPGLGIA